MVLFPRKNKEYWLIADLWEKFSAIPVTLISKVGLFDGGNSAKRLFIVCWSISEEYAQEYDATRRELFRTYRAAARVAKKLNLEAKNNAEG